MQRYQDEVEALMQAGLGWGDPRVQRAVRRNDMARYSVQHPLTGGGCWEDQEE